MRGLKILTIAIAVFIISQTHLGYGETDPKKVYGLNNKEELQKLIHEVEETLSKKTADRHTLKILGVAYHNLGTLRTDGAPKKAVEYLERAYNLAPEDYEILAYLGSAKTMIARDSWNVITKVSAVNKGINMMDTAISKAPDNIVIRMVRANNSLRIPEFFNRKDLAKKDFLYIERLVEKSPTEIDVDTKAKVFYQLGILYKSDRDESVAKIYFKKALESSPNSEWGIKAKKEM